MVATQRRGWVKWFRTVRWWLASAGIQHVDKAGIADLRSLFDRDFEPQEAAFSFVEDRA